MRETIKLDLESLTSYYLIRSFSLCHFNSSVALLVNYISVSETGRFTLWSGTNLSSKSFVGANGRKSRVSSDEYFRQLWAVRMLMCVYVVEDSRM